MLPSFAHDNGFPSGFLEDFFKKLDSASMEAPSALRNPKDKEWLENDVLTLAYRIGHANHHRNLLRERVAAFTSKLPDKPAPKMEGAAVARTKRSLSDPRPAYELSACLAAVRSAMDVVANVVATFLKGHERGNNSLNALTKNLAKGSSNDPLIKVVLSHWKEWALDAKDYRDDLVHKLVLITTSNSEEVHFQQGNLKTLANKEMGLTQTSLRAVAPMVIPRRPEKRPMTRAFMFHLSDEIASAGIIRTELHGTVTIDGKTTTIQRELKLEAHWDYVDIVVYADEVCANLSRLSMDVLSACSANGFSFVKK